MPSSIPDIPLQADPPDHYENFPVASWLCPPRLRPPISAIYAFARTADDIADEGNASASSRLHELDLYAQELNAACHGANQFARWPQVFGPLAQAIAQFRLPPALLSDLLDAFRQDVTWTHTMRRYADKRELLDYCQRSANPVGRLLLHLAGIDNAVARAQSDAICSALQLINFWQDLSVDLPRGRFYLPLADCAAQGLSPSDFEQFVPLGAAAAPSAARALVQKQVHWARALMHDGAPLVHQMPGRLGWELRLVVQGGLAILDKIQAQQFDSFSHRPTVAKRDAPTLLWRALRMRA